MNQQSKFFPQLKDNSTERPSGSTLNFFDATLVACNNGMLSGMPQMTATENRSDKYFPKHDV